ncbi:hypothetical protein SARC_08172 [Sphaeroforma arctica JP610]|uniref:Uncharacterized protein n=1 Tax=Sphaeroforma arctica JP610 TaxID=667725 RepID=A0A0L0FS73_9EUKA|nr:hypothetical protein SARC_08172 [Sphaeroforma arctica JP610]KNC79441.1 hypothetical protein SARC_08172 [Sphaeroforma arctica JP610]|eukprot:XP_014153343.1 hypothetical protein SARC_08172 [Sphaeroforma arctica JP610]
MTRNLEIGSQALKSIRIDCSVFTKSANCSSMGLNQYPSSYPASYFGSMPRWLRASPHSSLIEILQFEFSTQLQNVNATEASIGVGFSSRILCIRADTQILSHLASFTDSRSDRTTQSS